MKKIIYLLLILSFIACKNNDFNNYINSLNDVSLPHDFDINSTLNKPLNYNKLLFEKFKHKWSSYPYGIVYRNNKTIGIIEASIADNGIAPILITYDIIGNKIDSLNILENTSFSENSQTLVNASLDKNLNLFIIDSTKTWENDNEFNQISNSLKIKTNKTEYNIDKNGLINKIKESKTKIHKPTAKIKLSGIYKFLYEYNTADLIENHYIEFKDGKAFYYGTSDDFDEAREGYLPGFFSTEILDFKISEKIIDFTVNVTDSNFYKSPITPNSKPEKNELWNIGVTENQRRFIGEINNGIITLESKNVDKRVFKKQ